MFTGFDDQRARRRFVQAGQFDQFVHGQIGQVIAGVDAAVGQLGQQLGRDAFQVAQVLRDLFDLLLAGDFHRQQRILGTGTQLGDGVLVEGLDLEHFLHRDIGHLFEAGEAFGDQDVGHFGIHVELLDEELAHRFAFLLVLGRRLLGGHDVDAPAGQLGRQAHVLTTTADCDGEVFLVDDDVHRVALFIDDDGLHIGRRQRADDELGGVFAPQHDVDTLASQLGGHAVDAGAAHADAGADGVDTAVVADDGDLGAAAAVAGAALDLQQALLDLGHFLREQFLHELGRGARQHDLRAALGRVHAEDDGAHAVTGAQVLLRDHLAALEAAFDAAALDNDVALVQALDRADEDLFAARHEVVQQLLALGIADLLQDDLLGGLGTDAADRHRLDRLLDMVVHLDVGNLLLSFEQQDLGIGVLQASLIGHDMPAAEGLVLAGIAVHADADVGLTAVDLLGGRGQRGFHRTEHDIALHALLARDRIHQHQHFAVHCLRPPSTLSWTGAASADSPDCFLGTAFFGLMTPRCPGLRSGAGSPPRPLKLNAGTRRASRTSSSVKSSACSAAPSSNTRRQACTSSTPGCAPSTPRYFLRPWNGSFSVMSTSWPAKRA
mmetsp:Transcript_43697/g.77008  ORF Transcript_43697/g.77008 Transcript_43697/m.77008 type:complete len:607 (+) Transcript_43697:292-2112(+)